MHISGANRFAHMQNIRGNEDFLELPTNHSSRKKTFLYAALTAAGLGAAVLAYKAGIFSADPEVPPRTPNLFSPIPSFKDFDQNGTLLPGSDQSVVSLGQAFSPPAPPNGNGFCPFANEGYDPSQNPFAFESDSTEPHSTLLELPMIDKVDDVPFLDPRILLSKGNTDDLQINNLKQISLPSTFPEALQTDLLRNLEVTQPHGTFTYLITTPPAIRKTSELSQNISLSSATDHSNILAERDISLLDCLSLFSEAPVNALTNSSFTGNAFIIPKTNTSITEPFINKTVTAALDFCSVGDSTLQSDEQETVLQTNLNDEVETDETLRDSTVKEKPFSLVVPSFNTSQPVINGTHTPPPNFCPVGSEYTSIKD